VLNHIKKIYLPYTIIDIGWWYQLTLPRLPSGRIDYALTPGEPEITGDGNTPSALTDVEDIGRYTARIIADPRTLNHMVFAHSAFYTQNQVYDLIEKLSGEKIERKYV
jgi:nucleoside-diphosphate-sugar epimerase